MPPKRKAAASKTGEDEEPKEATTITKGRRGKKNEENIDMAEEEPPTEKLAAAKPASKGRGKKSNAAAEPEPEIEVPVVPKDDAGNKGKDDPISSPSAVDETKNSLVDDSPLSKRPRTTTSIEKPTEIPETTTKGRRGKKNEENIDMAEEEPPTEKLAAAKPASKGRGKKSNAAAEPEPEIEVPVVPKDDAGNKGKDDPISSFPVAPSAARLGTVEAPLDHSPVSKRPRTTPSSSSSSSSSSMADDGTVHISDSTKESGKADFSTTVLPASTHNISMPPHTRALVPRPPPARLPNGRSSDLSAPNMCLTGHDGAVLTTSFEPVAGKYLATGSFDTTIMLWDISAGCKNYNVLRGHKAAVLQVHWLPTITGLVSCSADQTAALWDCHKGVKLRKFAEHTGIVNTCSIASSRPSLLCTGSDDCSAVLWDSRSKQSVTTLYHDYQVTASALSADGGFLYTGGIDNIIRQWDLRGGGSSEPTLSISGHLDTITGLALSPDGCYLLSNAMDAKLCSWDIRPAAAGSIQRGLFFGHAHGAEKLLLRCSWSSDQTMIAGGSADCAVHIWDVESGQQKYLLGGHKASVNEIAFHPSQPIVASASSDKCVFVGELS